MSGIKNPKTNNNHPTKPYADSRGLPPTQQKPSMPPVKPPKESTNNDKKS